MGMPMMDVRVVWMLVRQRFMAMMVRMRLGTVPVEVVGVLVMLVVTMWVSVFERLVAVFMKVPFPHMKPNTE